MTRKWIWAILPFFLASIASAATTPDSSRGELLYSTNCIGCHDTQIHWRDKKIAKDWATLVEQVRHWQAVSGLTWGKDEVTEVARYLNARYYHYPEHVQ
jgi:mono/diheme cytochrome c family protein